MSKQPPLPFSYFFEILNSPRVKPIVQRFHPTLVLDVLKGVFDDAQQEVRTAITERRLPDADELITKFVARLAELRDDSATVALDARGRLAASEFERLAEVAVEERVWRAAEPVSDFSRRQDAKREIATCSRLAKLAGVESVVALSTVTNARIAVLQALANSGRGVVVSRRDMYERENGERLETAFECAPGLTRREVGASNSVSLSDYERAFGPGIGAIWRSFGRWRPDGRDVPVEDLTRARDAAALDLRVVADVEFAPLLDLSEYCDFAAPTVAARARSGCEVVICDGAQLIGGPNCGLIFCPRAVEERIRATDAAKMTKLDRVAFGALAKTAELYDQPSRALETIPILRMLSTSLANLQSRANRLAALLETYPIVQSARAIEGRSLLCSNATLGTSATWLVELRPRARSAAELAADLETGSPKLLVRWTRDALLIDLKTLSPEQDVLVAEVFERIAAETPENAPETDPKRASTDQNASLTE